MRTSHLLALVLLVGAVAVGIAAAHGNEVVVDDQLSDDGSLTVAHVTHLEDVYLVARTATGDGPGDPVGHRHLAVGSNSVGEHDLLSLRLNQSYWATVSDNESLWLVLHLDDGDETFSPGDDELLTQSNEPVGDRFTVGRANGSVSVVASDQETTDTVTIRRAELAAPGYVVLRAGDPSGRVIGVHSLAAGVHENVSVTVDGYHYNDANESFVVAAVVYRDTGDGAFGSEDVAVRAGDSPVASSFEVTKTVSTVEVTPTATATGTVSATRTATATATATAADRTATAAPTSTVTPTAPAEPAPTDEVQTADPSTETGATSADGGGFGALGALGAVAASLLGWIVVSGRGE